MISIVIPAHNEASVIARGLKALTEGACAGELEIFVVCNGCSDDTARVARQFPHVRVIETPVASKVHALNLGDQAATGFPRFYVDADVVITLESVRAIAKRLNGGAVLAAAPTIRHNLAACSWPVRAFYRIDARLPSSRDGIGGSGVYALSAEGRQRFGPFPAVTADDGFVRRSFRADEKCTVAEASSLVTPPRHLDGLIKIKTRSHLGNKQLSSERVVPAKGGRGGGNSKSLLRLGMRPWLWASLLVYCYVKLVARARSSKQYRAGKVGGWERDDSSREVLPPLTWADRPLGVPAAQRAGTVEPAVQTN